MHIINCPLFISLIFFYYHSSMIQLTTTLYRSFINMKHSVWLLSWIIPFWCLVSLFPLCFFCVFFLFLPFLFSTKVYKCPLFLVSILRIEPRPLCTCQTWTLALSSISRQASFILLFFSVYSILRWVSGQFFFSQVSRIPTHLVFCLGGSWVPPLCFCN